MRIPKILILIIQKGFLSDIVLSYDCVYESRGKTCDEITFVSLRSHKNHKPSLPQDHERTAKLSYEVESKDDRAP